MKRDETAFAREIFGDWWDDDKLCQLDALAAHWAQETEEFDQQICHCIDERGIALPITSEERRACTEFARELERDYLWIAMALGLTSSDWLAARGRAVRRFERQNRP